MELNTIKDAFDRVAKKQKLSSSKTQEVIEQLGQEIERALSKVRSVHDNTASQPDHKLILTELKTKLKDIAPLSQLEGTQKELNIALSKYPKLLEKSFNPDLAKAYRNVDFDTHTVNQIIASHFYQEGLFDLGDCFLIEAKETEGAALKTSYVEMYQILEAMRSQNLAPALNWAATNRDKLQQNGSDLELKLHRLQFIEILQKRGRDEAFKYARTFLAPFASNQMAEIQKLMACLLWAGRLDSSPYSELLSPTHWNKLAEELTRQFCNLLGQSYESPLSVTLAAGVQGLPTLLKLMNVMMGKKQEWQSMKQLPVPLDLDREFQFHSIFVCPVSRDQASEENPPMLLSCGHVLCKQSITKLSKNNSTRPFKCPYCPSEVEVAECRQLCF
uniref:RING-type E3 ubiquitin transferase n=1 Tax=Davidia involucrata TaxID=16924 RepID=A0A5B6YNN9_DAVIN